MRAVAVVVAVAGLMALLGAPSAQARCISVEVGGTTVPCADPNQAAVARALDSGAGNTGFNNLVLDVAALPAEEIPFALTELGNQIATVFPGILQGDRRAVIASFIDRLGPSCLQKQRPDDPASYDPTVWARGLYRKSDIWTAGGVTTGLEAHPDRHSCAGFGFNYMGTDSEFSGLPQGANLNAYNLGFYGRRDWRLLFVDGAAAGTYGTIVSARGIDFTHETARGNSVGLGAGLAVGVGVVLRFGAITMEPRIGLDYDHDAQGGFTERGAGAAHLQLSSSSSAAAWGPAWPASFPFLRERSSCLSSRWRGTTA